MSEDAGAAGAVGGVGVVSDDLEEGEVSGGGDADSDGEEEELKPLPDILTCISQKFRQVKKNYHEIHGLTEFLRGIHLIF